MSEQAAAVIRPRIHSANKRPLQDILPLKTPISAHIDVSSVCNYKCSFCFQADMEGMKKVGLKRGFMDLEMFKKIVDDCAAFPEKISLRLIQMLLKWLPMREKVIALKLSKCLLMAQNWSQLLIRA